MIVRRNLKLATILRLTWRFVLYSTLVGVLAAVLHHYRVRVLEVPTAGAAALGAALAIFLAFRNNASYDRWWEARKQWGQLVNSTRSFARQVLTMTEGDPESGVPALQRELLMRQVAFANALRLHLRRQLDRLGEVTGFVPEGELELLRAAPNVPLWILQRQADRLAELRRIGRLSDLLHAAIDGTFADFANILGACERIKNTPTPRQYVFYTRLFVYFYCTVLPFSLVVGLGFRTPILSVPIAFLFFALERVASFNEDPFENRIQDTPMSALCRTVERDTRALLGETDLPPPVEAIDGYLY